jgi:hypothetical protein
MKRKSKVIETLLFMKADLLRQSYCPMAFDYVPNLR